MTRSAARLSAGLVAVLTAAALTGCSTDPGDAGDLVPDPIGACVAPLACGPLYPAPVYPYMAHPFYGYFSPYASHVHITVVNGRPAPVYRPHVAPILPGYRPPPASAYRAPAARPAAPAKPAAPAPKPAAPAPRPPAPAPRPVIVRAGK